MGKLKKDLQAVTKQLKTLARKTEALAKKVDKLEKTQAAKKPKAKTKAKKAVVKKKSPTKKKAAEKTAAKKKVAKPTATDQVLRVITKAKKGVDVPGLMTKTGFDEKKVRNIVTRAFKLKKIKRTGRGVYIGG
ncbi:MAG: hypothetical protein KAT27_07655 [Desulfobacterales bacterium]|nr:hypothetical protein [Desulfobacterales bacterium]